MKTIYKKIIYSILSLFFVMLFALLILEGFLRLVSLVSPDTGTYTQGINPIQFMGYDPITLWKIKPNINVNVQLLDGNIFNVNTVDLGLEKIGFRDDGVNGSVYAVVLGDSFTFGAVDMQNTWVEKLETKSDKDFINMGVSAYSTIQSEKQFENYGIKLNPKLVLVQFYYNDIEGNHLLDDDFREVRNWLQWNTKTYSFIRYYKYKIFDSDISNGINYNDAKFNLTFQPSLLPHKEIVNSSATKDGIFKTKESLLNIEKLSSSIGAQMVVLIMPSKEQVYSHLISDKIPDFNEIDMDYYTNIIDQICIENSLICLNLVPSFREESSNSQLFYGIDSHFNVDGNEFAAEEIYNFLQSEGLLDLNKQ